MIMYICALCLILGENIKSFTFKYDACCRFFIDAGYQVEKFLFITDLLRVLIMNR